jgi:hypothetical protein
MPVKKTAPFHRSAGSALNRCLFSAELDTTAKVEMLPHPDRKTIVKGNILLFHGEP